MGIAENVGHNKNGKPLYKMDKFGEPLLDKKNNKIIHDDIPSITTRFKEHLKEKTHSNFHDHLGFNINKSLLKNDIFIPEYYNPEIEIELKKFNSLELKLYDLRLKIRGPVSGTDSMSALPNPEGFVDLPEPFIDSNRNGTWDDSELFTDSNGNRKFDTIYVTLNQPPYENENILYKTKWNEKDVTITEIKMKFEGEE